MKTLLDGNMLIALTHSDHVHHSPARTWFARLTDLFATCPITEGSMLRYVLRHERSPVAATAVLASVTSHPLHEFWPDEISYDDVWIDRILGHRQVTDAYLAQLARHHGGRLATFDEGLAALHSDVAELIPSLP